MIRYALKCPAGHVFDSWFRDSRAYETLSAEGRVACAICGAGTVEKALMAPSLRGDERVASDQRQAAEQHAPAEQTAGQRPAPPGPLAAPASPAERVLAGLRRYLSETSNYVGRAFPDEARRMHLGEAEERSIWGEASPDEARALRDEGVPVAPLPWLSRRDD
jgi:hypothetical protein